MDFFNIFADLVPTLTAAWWLRFPPAIGNDFDLKMGIPHVTGCFKKRILNNWMMI